MNEYLERVKEFLRKTNTDLTIKFVEEVIGFPFGDDKLPHNKYSITLRRNGRKFVYPFYDSYYNTKNNVRPNEYDVLSCLNFYEVEDMWDFANEFGYTVDSQKTYDRLVHIWTGVKDEYDNLCKLFNNEEIERLAELAC